MRKFLLATILFLSLSQLESTSNSSLFGLHSSLNPAPREFVDDDTDGISTNDVRIDIEESVVKVYGAEGMTFEVVSLTGLSVYKVKIENKAQIIELKIPKGCYIMKVGTVVRKIAIR